MSGQAAAQAICSLAAAGWDSHEGLMRLVVETERARAIDSQQQEGAGDRHVLHEHDHLHPVRKIGVEQGAGQGVLRECLQDATVSQVVCVGRTPLGMQHPKIEELVKEPPFSLDWIKDRLCGLDACFFCLGVSSSGMSEESYRHLTHDLTLSVAALLAGINPNMIFVCVLGAGTGSSERGRSVWARVKGTTENALLRLSFKAAYMFRPGVIVPLDGIQSKTPSYRLFYTVLGALLSPLQRLFPRSVSTTRAIGRAMLEVTRYGAKAPILDARGNSRRCRLRNRESKSALPSLTCPSLTAERCQAPSGQPLDQCFALHLIRHGSHGIT